MALWPRAQRRPSPHAHLTAPISATPVARQATLTMRKGRPTTKLSKASSGKKPAAGPNSMGKAGDWALLNGGAKEEEFLPMEVRYCRKYRPP